MSGNRPLYTFLTVVVMLCVAGAVLIFAPFDAAHNTDLAIFFGILTSSLPGLVSAFFAERGSKDIRNGVVVDKAKQGASAAIDESGLTEHVHAQAQAQQAATAALITLLQDRVNQDTTTSEPSEQTGQTGGARKV